MKRDLRIVTKKIAIICLSVVLFANFHFSLNVYAAEAEYTNDKNWNRANAAAYANKWALKYNTKEYYKANYDCTNFVSQCLEKGGKKRSSTLPDYYSTKHWRPHSATWENANYFRKYWRAKVANTGKNIKNLSKKEKLAYADKMYNKLYNGDVIQWGYSKTDTSHSQIVWGYDYDSKTSSDTLKLAQHTYNTRDLIIHDYITTTNYTYVRYYQMINK